MKKKIVIITSKSLRHKYFRVFLSNQKGINVLKTVCEDGNKKLKKLKRNYRLKSNLLAKHIFDRDKSERDLFKPYLKKQETDLIILIGKMVLAQVPLF